MKKNQWKILILVFAVVILLWTIGMIPKGIARLSGTSYVKQHFPEMKLKCIGVEYADVFGDYLIAFEGKDGNRYSCVISPKILPVFLGQGLSEIESDYEEYCKLAERCDCVRYLIIPEIIYIILLLGSLIFSFVSIFMIIKGVIKGNSKQYFIKWGIIFVVSLIIHLSTRTGVIVVK